ncbi:hypothetical protein BATDEDRAFT_19332 [Batrachochytrium dendrobatidis JAM81]|uniref:protein-tyrosine-phosphatase n=2 Tax=Batrachochytrium dendrobatidis TaxID=109871 RepID=F4P0M7_BATDJ|nr:uncharacterized protein BATDEDRAFT_19332 [Batrachochytrium dendrobatidis JAM81]EGF81307.1 hypothetical protein BATDEDRAFT_19332 [Batrachochytrium dendrobatidis JAM81]KAK5669554.1 hypothetical protein QVD99_003945 [Batrachochytrium dendrobatidis]OAJ38074.1 protein-tyrosine phosphatase [Batrachochytrium dendrobatidis JEL423]|eukprot:XP_006677817.1 hypothetical protein BATDEDRAFT_19332 [Batrachochytrium dendrobatidis JAM81]
MLQTNNQLHPPSQPHRQHTASNSNATSARLANQPTLIEFKHLRFLVFDAPSDRIIDLYIKEFQNHNVTDVVRVCDSTYDRGALEKVGIKVHDWPFPDGEAPSDSIVHAWLNLVMQRFSKDKKDDKSPSPSPLDLSCIGVHCVAGLGRAPVLVAMALIEAGMAPLDSVIYIRERRRGAINARQLKYLEAYKRRGKEKTCIIQ